MGLRRLLIWSLIIAVLAAGVAVLWSSLGQDPAVSVKILAQLNKSMAARKVRGLTLRFQEAGQGPAVVFLHGLGGSAFSWRHLMPALAARHRVIALDLKGFGLSAKPQDGKYSLADQADLLIEFLKDLGLNQATLVGNSLGGAVALAAYFKLALDPKNPSAEPRKTPLAGLVLLGAPTYQDQTTLTQKILLQPWVLRLITALVPQRLQVSTVLRLSFSDPAKITPDMVETYSSYAELPNYAYAVRQTLGQMIPPDIGNWPKYFKKISIPVLLVWGEGDRLVPVATAERLENDIPGSRLVLIPNCGHIPQEEAPQAFRHALETFLARDLGQH